MKKLLLVLAAAFAMVACQTDLNEVNVAGGEVDVTFEVGAPAARAYSDGATATVLQYAVYEGEDELTALTHSEKKGNAETINISTTVSMKLVTGNTYTVIFWADNDNAPYTVDFGAKTMTVDYTGVASNDENLDAFYAVHEFTVNGAQTETIELKRPFAQLNIGTSDYVASANAGYTPDQSYVKVTNIYNTLNLWTGEATGEAAVEFEYADINKNETFPVAGYEYLAMNYLLVKSQKEVVDVEFAYKETSTGDAKTRTVGSVPVQRNYRTNIYGQLLTSDVDINVVIKPAYDDAYNNEGYFIDGDKAVVESANGLATIANAIEDGTLPSNTDIVLEGNIDLSELALTRTVESNWSPIGTSENPFTGTFDGKGYTIKNLALVESEAKEGKAYIGFFGYAKNAIIKNVVFENVYINIPCLDIDHSQGHIGAVAGSLEGTSTIENVTVKGDIKVYATQNANGASRVAVVAGGNSYGYVTMKNVHVVANEGSYLTANNNTGALAGQLQGKMVFENCSSNIDVTVNKFFAGGLVGIAAGDSYFKNCHTTGDVAVVAGREGRANDHYRVGGIAGGWADGATKVCTLENCSYTGQVSGTNADGSVAETLDYFGYVGRGYTLSNCEGSTVIVNGTEFVQVGNTAPYGVYTINGCTPVSTADELVATLAAGEGVYLLNDITIAATKGGYDKAGILQNKAQTIDGGGHTLTVTGAGATWDCAIYTNGGTIRNLIVKGAMRGIFTAGQSSDLHIDNVEFKNVIYTFNSDGKMPANPFGVYVSNSKVNGWTSHSNMHTEVVYTNCSFGEGSGYKYCRPYGKTEFVNCTFCAGYNVDKSMTNDITFTGCTWE